MYLISLFGFTIEIVLYTTTLPQSELQSRLEEKQQQVLSLQDELDSLRKAHHDVSDALR